MTRDEKLAYVHNNLSSATIKLGEVAGPALAVELRMRLIGQFSEPVRVKLKQIQENKKKEKKYIAVKEYLDCNLEYLDDAIIEVFKDKLQPNELVELEQYRPLRNKLLHADFVNLMIRLGIEPSGRQFFPKTGTRNALEPKDIKEAFLSIISNQGFEKMRSQANGVIVILNKIICDWT